MKEQVMEQVRKDIKMLAEEGIVEFPSQDELADVVEAYERDFGFMGSFEDWVEHHGETYLVADLVFRYLEQRNVAIIHDSECIYGYQDDESGYPSLINQYVALAPDLFDGLGYTIKGDWSANEDAHITIELNGQSFSQTMMYNSDYADIDSLLELLNRVVSEATDASQRFQRLQFSDGTGVTVGFVHPDAGEILRKYFRTAIESRRGQQS